MDTQEKSDVPSQYSPLFFSASRALEVYKLAAKTYGRSFAAEAVDPAVVAASFACVVPTTVWLEAGGTSSI